jgi:2,3-bisphosphoglycerate-dependent phosphoglycerate mutase
VKKGERLIIVAHGNSLRSLVMHLDNLTKEQVLELNIPTGVPLVYEFDGDAKPVSHRYL